MRARVCVCVCVCLSVCVRARVYTHAYTHIHRYKYTYKYIYIHVCRSDQCATSTSDKRQMSRAGAYACACTNMRGAFFRKNRKSGKFSFMGWLRLVGSLKVTVFFAKEPYKTEDILQKRLIILRSLLIVATLYLSRARTIIQITCVLLSLSLARACCLLWGGFD